jgi:penicillin-binding protein 1C
VKRRFHRWLRRLVISSGIVVVLLVVLWLTIPRAGLYREDISWSPVLRDRDGQVLHFGLAADERYRIRLPLADVSPKMVEATLAYEDERFHSHGGVDPVAMLRALMGQLQGVSRGGGSTITMQYARLRFGLSTRTLTGKCIQILRAVQLEKYYTKEQILEAYLNTAPYGGNVEGVAAASLRWCGKEAGALDWSESVALVMVPQRPTARRPRADVEETSDTMAARRRLLQKLGHADAMLAEYRWEALPVPREVPHLALRLRGVTETSTIDRAVQRVVEETVRDYLLRVEEKGVGNAAVMVVDAPTREVRAYLGSGGFFDERIEGQIDACRAKRSPGSLYKTFLYGLAIDQGLIHPNTLLADAPMRFRDYNPENYERDFLGPVKAGEALYRSRNLPALALMQQLKGRGLYDFLLDSGVRIDHGAGHYGLALALGAAAATPEEMAMLYAALVDDGISRPLVYQKEAPARSSAKRPLLSAGSRWLLRHMLADTRQRDPFLEPTVSYKTGTSQGFRDAWAIGVSGCSVIVVWIGNFDASPNPAFKGRSMAAPLMAELFQRTRLAQPLPEPPSSVKHIDLCAVSGMMPCGHCQHRAKGWFLADVSPIKPCDLHRLVWVDSRTGLRVAPRDDDPHIKAQICEFWSPEFLELFRLAGLPRRSIPESVEVMAQSNEAPQITSPIEGHVYQIGNGLAGLICRAKASAGASRLYWFGNGAFLGSTAPSEAYVWQDADGSCVLHVMDDRGLSATTRVMVERQVP